ncbi:hypothetical protein TNCV_4339891 [Trichonephila clavipes]|nr:hypothetical protein TNCV_4339891 [Trichonephila clavipes]
MRNYYLPKLVSFASRCKKHDFSSTALNIKFCQSFGKTPMETMEILSKVYGESTMARSKIYECHRRFKESRESIKNNERVGRPSTSWNTENVALVSECVRKDRRQTCAQITVATHFSKTPFEGIHSS